MQYFTKIGKAPEVTQALIAVCSILNEERRLHHLSVQAAEVSLRRALSRTPSVILHCCTVTSHSLEGHLELIFTAGASSQTLFGNLLD